jgi:hypothetical protein
MRQNFWRGLRQTRDFPGPVDWPMVTNRVLRTHFPRAASSTPFLLAVSEETTNLSALPSRDEKKNSRRLSETDAGPLSSGRTPDSTTINVIPNSPWKKAGREPALFNDYKRCSLPEFQCGMAKLLPDAIPVPAFMCFMVAPHFAMSPSKGR